MAQDLRLFLIRHGAIVVLLGALSGLGYMFVITGDMPGSMSAWHLAHLQGILTGILILAGSSFIDYLKLSLKLRRIISYLFVITGYCYSIGPAWGAVFNVRGIEPALPITNFVMFISNTVASIAVVAGLGITICGSRKR